MEAVFKVKEEKIEAKNETTNEEEKQEKVEVENMKDENSDRVVSGWMTFTDNPPLLTTPLPFPQVQKN